MFLIKSSETYRINNESEVNALLEESKNDSSFELRGYTTKKKDVKVKGEIVDTYYLVTLIKAFNDENDPE